MTVWIHQDDPEAVLIKMVDGGRRELPRSTVERQIGHPVNTPLGFEMLGRAGLAVVALSETDVLLQSIDGRAAQIINRARLGPSRSGIRAARLVEAFLPVRHPDRTRIRVTDERRLHVAIILENDFDIDAIELLEGTDRVHLRSSWTVK